MIEMKNNVVLGLTLILIVLSYLSYRSYQEFTKEMYDRQRAEDLRQIQYAINSYEFENNQIPFRDNPPTENYKLLMDKYFARYIGAIPYDPDPRLNGKLNGKPECYQVVGGECTGIFWYDIRHNEWMMQVRLQRKTDNSGLCIFEEKASYFCIGNITKNEPLYKDRKIFDRQEIKENPSL